MRFVKDKCYFLPKAGNSKQEYEDAFFFGEEGYDVAISDGATESSFSKEWANQLVAQICCSHISAITQEWLNTCIKSFMNNINTTRLSWNAEAKFFSQGSFATLSAIHLDGNVITGLAIGDSCLFFVDKNRKLIDSFPYKRSEQFSSTPLILGTCNAFNARIFDDMASFDIRFDVNNDESMRIYLATDAISFWILSALEKGRNPFITLDAIKNEKSFSSLVNELRNKKLMRNDDVTLVVVQVGE